jgi:hypothetical protein
MPQIFSQPATIALKFGLFLAVLLIVSGVLAARAVFGYASAFGSPVGQPLEQPIPFSHRHHVSDDGIDCRYCHTSVESSSFAGIPSTQICMTCHSVIFDQAPMLAPVRRSWQARQPIRWRRVNDLPDFVFFDHSIHVAKGVGCVTCHGRVDQMPITWRAHSLDMKWCLDCHRAPQRYLRPKDRVFDMSWSPSVDQSSLGRELAAAYHIQSPRRLTDCSTCHR